MEHTKLEPTTSHHTYKLFISLGVFIIIVFISLLFYFKNKESTQANMLKKDIPDYFINPGVPIKMSQTESTQNYKLLDGENLSPDGLQYVVTTSYKQAIRDILTTMNQKGWVAIGGSNQTSSSTMIKMNNGERTLFITLKLDSDNDDKTTITIVPAIKSK